MRMVRWMCGVSLREKTNAELRESMDIEKISDVMRCSRLRWMGCVLRKEGNDWVKKSMEMTVEGSRGRGRPKMTWEKVVERDMKVRGLVRNDAKDGVKWRALSWGAKVNSHKSGKNGLKMFVVVVFYLAFKCPNIILNFHPNWIDRSFLYFNMHYSKTISISYIFVT